MTTLDWPRVSVLLMILAATIAGFVAYRELGKPAHSRHIQIADTLLAELNSSENVKARRWIYHHLPPRSRTRHSIVCT